MKNFKKVLALVLAVVMLLSFATVASAVTSDFYEDVDDIDYTEAVDVLGSIGVLEGYPDNTFRPEKTITRAEAAKIIAMFDNKSSKINGLYASANPFSDCVDHWAESYIAYGAKTGIIAGVGGDKFAPSANVTGVQFLKMVLVVLGYDAKAEGLEGKNWDVNTLALAKRAGLTATLGVKFDYSADLKRQEAATIMLDALRADTVVYGNALGANVSKLLSEIDKFSKADSAIEAFAGLNVNGVIYVTVVGAVKTGDKLMKDWDLAEGYDTDAFYRPYRTWLLNDKEIGRYMLPAKAEYTTRITGCDLLVDLGVAKTNTTKTLTAARYLNGLEKPEVNVNHSKVTAADDCAALDTKLGGQGVLTQVFYLTDAQAETMGFGEKAGGYYITEIATWLGQVEKASKTTVNRDGHKVDGTEAEITVFNGKDAVHSFECLNFPHQTFTTTDVKLAEDDYVLVTYSYRDDDSFDAGIVDVEVVKPVAGKLTGYKTVSYPSQTAVDGTYIPDSWHFHLGYEESKVKDNVGGQYDFFYDAYGNVIGMKPVDPAATQYLVIDKLALTQESLDAVVRANVVGLDAKSTDGVSVAQITVVNKDDNTVITVEDLVKYSSWNGLFFWSSYLKDILADDLATWKLDEDGRYVIDLTVGTRYEETGVYVTPTDGYVYVYGEDDIKTDSSTQYLIHENDGSYTAVTGFKNMDELTAENVEFVDNDDDGVAEIVYLWGAIARAGDEVTGYVSKVPEWVDGDYYKLTVYVGATATEISIDDESYGWMLDSDGTFTPGFYTFCYTDIGTSSFAVVVEGEPWSLGEYGFVTEFAALHDGTIEFMNSANYGYDSLYDGNYAIAKDIAIYSIRTDGTVHAEETSYLESIKVGAKCYVFDNKGVYELYVVETIDAPKF